MQQNLLLIGYRLNDALLKLPHDKEIIVEVTKAPSIAEENEFYNLNPIVVKHVENEERIVLTVSYFR
ncbi:MAG: hypothetical protein ACOX89_08415 [Lutispora sp.]|uniref:hypothetical protein n=1 Tax=Lutispora sp. TaxID=2828727 RepID=UPI003564D75E